MIIYDASTVPLTPELFQEAVDRITKQGLHLDPRIVFWQETYLRLKEYESEDHEN